eukprot:2308999-Amphidinium_carterae.1
MSYYVPSSLYLLDVSIARNLDQIGFFIKKWIEQHLKSVYVPLNKKFHTAMDNKNLRKVENQLVAKTAFMATAEVELEPHAMAVQLQTLPQDVNKHFAELAKAYPILIKAVRNTVNQEKGGRRA